MHIQNSELFQFYLGQNNSTEDDLEERKATGSLVELAINISFASRYVWASCLIVGLLGFYVLTKFGSAWNEAFALIALFGILGALPMIYMFTMEIKREKDSQPKVLDKPSVSIAEYKRLVGNLSHILNTDQSIIDGLTIEELQELSTKELQRMASIVVGKQKVGDDKGYREKALFRETHAMMYKLGLVQANYGRYFPAE